MTTQALKDLVDEVLPEGVGLTDKEYEELHEWLEDDILNRYHYPEYWNPDIVHEFLHEIGKV